MSSGSNRARTEVVVEAEGGDQRLYLGLDFGTSGARFALIDKEGAIQTEAKREYPLYMVRI